MNFAVLCYDFPHWKTQMGLFMMEVNEIIPKAIIAQPWKKLNIVPSPTRIVHKDLFLMHPVRIADSFGSPYYTNDHNSEDARDVIKAFSLDFGVILGSRMISKETIACFKHGIINIHPGALPLNRGLDNVKWAISKNLPMEVTAHWINEKVDAGKLMVKAPVNVYKDDTLLDIQFRVQNAEIELLEHVLNNISNYMPEMCPDLSETLSPFKPMSEIEEYFMKRNFNDYLVVYASA